MDIDREYPQALFDALDGILQDMPRHEAVTFESRIMSDVHGATQGDAEARARLVEEGRIYPALLDVLPLLWSVRL